MYYHPFAVTCKLFWELLRFAVATVGLVAIILFVQLHVPNFLGVVPV